MMKVMSMLTRLDHHQVETCFPGNMLHASVPLRVKRIQRFCLQDGPGIRTTVFTQGCTLRCWWCHNPDTRSLHDAGEIDWDAGELADFVSRDARYWSESGGGITVSGGECLMQPEALAGFLSIMKGMGHHTCIETAGAVPRQSFASLAPLVDLWLFDIKAIDPERFREGTHSRRVDLPMQNLTWLLSRTDTPVTVRIPLIGGFNSDEVEVGRISRFLSNLPRPVPVEVLPGHTVGCKLGASDPNPEVSPVQADAAASALKTAGLEALIRW